MRTQSDVKQEVLILTDGMSNCGGNATIEALALQDFADVFGLIIGTNTQAGQAEISSYVSTPVQNHLFALPNYQNLTLLVDLIAGSMESENDCAPFNLY